MNVPGLDNRQMALNIMHRLSGLLGTATPRKEFAEHFLCGHDLRTLEGATGLQGGRVPLVPLVRKSDPVQGIGEDTSHSTGRFGVP